MLTSNVYTHEKQYAVWDILYSLQNFQKAIGKLLNSTLSYVAIGILVVIFYPVISLTLWWLYRQIKKELNPSSVDITVENYNYYYKLLQRHKRLQGRSEKYKQTKPLAINKLKFILGYPFILFFRRSYKHMTQFCEELDKQFTQLDEVPKGNKFQHISGEELRKNRHPMYKPRF